ncbi:MAG: hypothetical protein ACE149_15930 [Armatimonadota bacterium]
MCDCCKPKAASAAAAKCEKGKDPKACSPKQIRECHGEAKVHVCVATAKASK